MTVGSFSSPDFRQMRCVFELLYPPTTSSKFIQRTSSSSRKASLPFLRGAADRVEKRKLVAASSGPSRSTIASPNSPLHFFGLTAEHGGLICHAHRF